jgi:hypothetical protein
MFGPGVDMAGEGDGAVAGAYLLRPCHPGQRSQTLPDSIGTCTPGLTRAEWSGGSRLGGADPT